MGRRLPPWRQSREPSLSATVGPETVLASSVIAFIVDSHVAGRVLRKQSTRRPGMASGESLAAGAVAGLPADERRFGDVRSCERARPCGRRLLAQRARSPIGTTRSLPTQS